MKKARKVLAEKRNSLAVVNIPVIPTDKLQKIAQQVRIAGKQNFIRRLYAYWTLKRQSRYGVPLLRRLQSCQSQKPRSEQTGEPRAPSASGGDVMELTGEHSMVVNQLRYAKRLRRDFEKVRLLLELVRKRERMKKERILVKEAEFEARFNPLARHLRFHLARNRFVSCVSDSDGLLMPGRLQYNSLVEFCVVNEKGACLEKVKALDTQDMFGEPVDTDTVTDYLDVVNKPMDFSTIDQNVDRLRYLKVDDFACDVRLVFSNCILYNKSSTIFHKAAVKIAEQIEPILAKLKESVGKNSKIFHAPIST